MGFFICAGKCIACGALITFNPERVPSLTVNGEREPLCLSCAERWKVIQNQPDWPIDPQAYEPAEEG